MLGGRGVPQANPQVAALAMIADLIQIIEASKKTLPAAVAEMRAAEAAAIAAQGELEKARVEHDARHAEIDKRSQAADARDSDLKTREAAAVAREVAAANRQAEFDEQAADAAAALATIAARNKSVEDLLKAAQQDMRRAKARLDQDKANAGEEIARKQREAEVAVAAMIENTSADLASKAAAADAEIAARKAAMQKAEAEFAGRQKTAHERARQLREALSQE